MLYEEKAARAFYYPNLFFSLINNDVSLTDLNLLQEEGLSIVFHEYVHFLQNSLTTFGLYAAALFYKQINELKKRLDFYDNLTFQLLVKVSFIRFETAGR